MKYHFLLGIMFIGLDKIIENFFLSPTNMIIKNKNTLLLNSLQIKIVHFLKLFHFKIDLIR
ncbi:hypothetical protein DERP_007122 [Dermatophagoides pteronyssinus]|uniref:Uncharacterized protein n=1 Tax=Dermatophagoides pteronyssinus TaxID=6956 RepID=A0ABQ8JUC9_DERPT|nr:hypothetical protein DERP_007122 [Dermatophagoides pteronyssinus]